MGCCFLVSAHQFPPHPLTIVYLDHLAVVAEPAEAPKCKRSEKHLVSFLGFPLSCTSEGSATANTVVEVLRVGFSDYVAGETTFKPICVLVY